MTIFHRALCLAWFLTAPAYALAYDPPATVVEDDITYTIHWDGSYDYEEALTLRINSASAVAAYSQAYITDNGPADDIKILNAYTLTPAGQRIDVLPDQILDQPFGDDWDNMFTNASRKVIIFPALSKGAIEHYHYILAANGTELPGQFFTEVNFPVDKNTLLATVTVIAPSAVTLHFEASGLSGCPLHDPHPGESEWQYILNNQPAQIPEDGSVNVTDFSPRLDITSFDSYSDIAAAYQEGAADKAAVTPAIEALSDQITKGISDPEARAKALYDWVAGNIRYVAIDLGYSGFVPNDAEYIAQARYGDCKDHTTLLAALLAAQHIASTGVLINGDDEYHLPKIAVPYFNHIISYIPRFNLFLDSTAQFAPFGVLPTLERGKLGLITGAPGIPPKLITIPLSGPVPDKATADIQAVLDPNGKITGTIAVQGSGFHEMDDREFFVAIKNTDEQLAMASLLQNYDEQGDSSLSADEDPSDLSKNFTFTGHFELPYYAQLPDQARCRYRSALRMRWRTI
jgi:hypothetical protein